MASSSNEKQVKVCGVEDFKLSLDENSELGANVVEKSVVAKLYSKRTIFNGLLRTILGRKWRLANGWKLIEVGPNTFIIQLTRKQEAVNIVRNGPWTIGNGFLVVKAMSEDGRWKSADLNSTPIWVRVYEVPPRFWTQKNANAIAKKIGTVVSIDRLWRDGFPTNKYIRLQVSIPLNKPLFVGLFLPMEEGVSLWCYFKHENMPSVCYKCGIVGHEELFCRRKRRLIADDFNRTVPMYGPWIRLGSRKKDCFSDYELYEQDRMNREVLEAQNQAEARALLIPGEDNFEPALVGTEIHLEALVEAAAAKGDTGNSMSEGAVVTIPPEEGEAAGECGLPVSVQGSGEGQEGNLSLQDVHGTLGNVVHMENKDNTCGFSEGVHQTFLNKKEEVKKVGEVDSSHVDHLAMVFKATLASRNGSAHKRSRPVRGKGKMLAINDGPKLSYDNTSGVGKKRRLEVLEGGSSDRPWKAISHAGVGNEEDVKKDSDQSNGEEADASKKVIASLDWMIAFNKAGVRNLPIRFSDHGAIMLDTMMDRDKVVKPFRYLDAWSRDPDCRRVIEEAWSVAFRGFHSFILIWATRRFIVDNSVWLLGIDANVKIGSQQWMGTDGEVMTLGDLNPMIEEGMCVGDLIMEDGRSWNENLVNSWFRPDAAAAILKITLPFPYVETRLYWKDDPSGCFSLKSVYWRLNQNRFDCIDVVFKSLWKSHIHERLKIFLWRLGQNALPFGCKVASIFGSNVGPCMLCGLDEMDVVSHFVSGCNITRAVWFSSQWGVRVERCNLTNGRDVLAWLVDPSSLTLDSSGCEDFLLYGALLYHKLWQVRNNIFHNKGILVLDEVKKSIEKGFREFKQLRLQGGIEDPQQGGICATRWGLPRPARMKCFVDFASASDGGAVAAAIYDISGTIFAIAAAKAVVKSPLHGELEALRFGFNMAAQLGVDVGTFYSDNQTLVKAFIE
ncbi:hypothetical protein F8388_014798 [Cannabis sativa]|uniref:CCHC-type domain-containing protein n=1 Tax=Cannabis sativa TaxID=3483 RepID=A0A7J6GZ48_CANSA|nr:hypothetical protein F8388_014798 [Cannabis sativa]